MSSSDSHACHFTAMLSTASAQFSAAQQNPSAEQQNRVGALVTHHPAWDESSHRWVPARTPTVTPVPNSGKAVGGPIRRSASQQQLIDTEAKVMFDSSFVFLFSLFSLFILSNFLKRFFFLHVFSFFFPFSSFFIFSFLLFFPLFLFFSFYFHSFYHLCLSTPINSLWEALEMKAWSPDKFMQV